MISNAKRQSTRQVGQEASFKGITSHTIAQLHVPYVRAAMSLIKLQQSATEDELFGLGFFFYQVPQIVYSCCFSLQTCKPTGHNYSWQAEILQLTFFFFERAFAYLYYSTTEMAFSVGNSALSTFVRLCGLIPRGTSSCCCRLIKKLWSIVQGWTRSS